MVAFYTTECFYSPDGCHMKCSIGVSITLRVLVLVLASWFFLNDTQL